jgi:hypothetical protein
MAQHYIEIKTVNAKMKRMYGDKLTWTEKGIERRSNGLHVELRFSTRYGRISFSCTLADGVGGCRFKMIGYSHPYRWSTIRIAVTEEQEARLFAKACEMADISISKADFWALTPPAVVDLANETGVLYGPNHIKYDKWGATFSFISKHRIWRMHPANMICNEAVANVMLVDWPGLLDVNNGKTGKIVDPATITPDQFHYLAEYYFNKEQVK